MPPLLFGVALLVGLLLHWLVPIRFAQGTVAITTLRWIGAMLVLAGIALAMSARVRFSRAGTNVNPMMPVTALVLTGPYRFTRNPMYLGLTLFVVGVALLANAVWLVVLLVPTLVVLHREVIAKEERFLDQRFGDDYRAFRKRVRRWL